MASDIERESPPLIDEPRVDLYERRAEVEHLGGLVWRADAATRDDREVGRVMRDVRDEIARAVEKEWTTCATVLAFLWRDDSTALGRRISRDDTIDLEIEADDDHLIEFVNRKIRRYLYEDGSLACFGLLGKRALGVADFSEEPVQLLLVLQVAQARSVGRADIDFDVVDMSSRPSKDANVVLGGTLIRSVFHLAERDADGKRGSFTYSPQISRDDTHSRAIEAHAVDDAAIFVESEETRAVVATLRLRRDRTDGAETEKRLECGYDARVLVEPGGKADGRIEGESEFSDRVRGLGSCDEPA